MDLQAVDTALSQIAGRSRRPQDTADAERRFAEELSGALTARRQELDSRPPRPSAPRTRPEDDIADRRPAARRPESGSARAEKSERSEKAAGEAASRKERRRDDIETADAAPEPKRAAVATAEQDSASAAIAEEAATADPTVALLTPPALPLAPALVPGVPVLPVVQAGLTVDAEPAADVESASAAAVKPPAGDAVPDQAAASEPMTDPDAVLAASAHADAAADAIADVMAKMTPVPDGETAPASVQASDLAEPAVAPQPQTPPAAAAASEAARAAQAASVAPPPAEPAAAAMTAASTTVAAATALPTAKDEAPPADTLSAEAVVAIDRPVRDTSRRAGDTIDPAALLAVSTAASEGAGTEIPAGQVAGNLALLRAAATAAAPMVAFTTAVQEAGLDDAKPAGIAEAKEVSGSAFGQAGIDRRAGLDAAVRAEQAQSTRQNLPVPPVANQIAVRMAKQAQTGEGRITLQLNPEVLGAVDVDLQIRKDGTMKAVISVEKPETLEWLKRDAQHLERALQEVGVKTDSGSLSFALREQRQDGSGGFGGRGSRREPTMTEGADAVGGRRGEAMMADIAARRMARGGVDVKI